MTLGLVAVSLLASSAIVWLVRRYALRRGVMDVPNDRSSHVVPTPRGGGIGIVVPVIASLLLVAAVPQRLQLATAIFVVAVVGWMDDRSSLSFKPRLAIHFVSGVLVAWAAWRMNVGVGIALPVVAGATWWIFWTMAAINVVNFMDGIDGIIALQLAVFAGFVVIAVRSSADPATVVGAVSLGAAVGFLLFNWPPARIFMGDVGSGAIGVLCVVLGVLTIRARGWSVAHAFLPLMPLFADELDSVVRRLRKGMSLTVAHRTHVYQRLVQAFPGHAKVSFGYGAAAALCACWAIANPSLNQRFLVGAFAILVLMLLTMIALRSLADRAIR